MNQKGLYSDEVRETYGTDMTDVNLETVLPAFVMKEGAGSHKIQASPRS